MQEQEISAGQEEQQRLAEKFGEDFDLDPDLALELAISEGDVLGVLLAIERGAHLNGRASDTSPIHYAIVAGWPAIVALLIEAGCDIEREEIYERENRMESAARSGDACGRDTEAALHPQEMPRTPLVAAAFCGEVEAVALLMRAGANPEPFFCDNGELALSVIQAHPRGAESCAVVFGMAQERIHGICAHRLTVDEKTALDNFAAHAQSFAEFMRSAEPAPVCAAPQRAALCR